jgi:hypothetical protein
MGMNTTEIKELVRDWYGSVAAGNAGCCGPAAASQETSCGMGYSEAELASLPEGADLGLGCGNPQAIAAMRPAKWSSTSAAVPGSIVSSRRSKSGRPAG